jgi:hypothetical protein
VNGAELLAGIRDGNYHAGGIRCLRIFQLERDHLAKLRGDVERLCQEKRSSNVNDPSHITNWTRPRGQVLQFSLLNASGRCDDFSTDHDLSCFGKQFHAVTAYPHLAHFITLFPHTVNFRIIVIASGARLSAHEEHSVIRTRRGTVGVRARFHLPVVSNSRAELMLDGCVYHLGPGTIYFVNHGCIHAASNGGDEHRIHLVWDMLLTREVYDFMFAEESPARGLLRVNAHERIPLPLRSERIGAHLQLPSPVTRDEARELDWCVEQ